MKNGILTLCLFFAFKFIPAQELGLRFGSVTGDNNTAIDAVFATSKFSRVHADLSFNDGVGIDLLWDFIYRPLYSTVLDSYVGVGPYIWVGEPFQLGVAAELGLAYALDQLPLVISIDWRPAIEVISKTKIEVIRIGLNIRYLFPNDHNRANPK